MSISRTLTVGACLLSVTGFAGAQAEVFTAAAVAETPDTQITLPASPPAPMPQPAEVSEPAAEPAPAAKAIPAIAPAPARRAASASAASGAELECLAKVVLYEAGSEPRAGQLAVAQVVMNRLR